LNLRPALEWIARRLPPARLIFDREGISPYLSRYYLLGRPHMPDGSDPIDEFGSPKKGAIFPNGIHVYLHKFHRSDQDVALHNHPWHWARSLILAGGYSEERRTADRQVTRTTKMPGSFVRIDADDYHRVDLLEKDSWSLFIAGPKKSSWNFWDRHTGEIVHWREYIARIRGDRWDGAKN
jgi:hypothetical protein